MAASHSPLDVIECLDESKVLVWTATESLQMGKPLFIVHELTDHEADVRDYDADAVEKR